MDPYDHSGTDPTLETPVTRHVPTRRLNDLAISAEVAAQLRGLIESFRARERGGFVVLFSGPSGTGKTMAAEAVAAELGVDLYRVDLSRVVSKYIGETEKNLIRIFEEAERANGVLFFSEADALFGKRSEVKDGHDRYANMKIGYLLQRIEEYPGAVILTSNLRPDVDQASLRRLDRLVDFPQPDAKHRPSLWRRLFRSARGSEP